MNLRSSVRFALGLFACCAFAVGVTPMQVRAQGDSGVFAALKWRGIGPFRAGRTVAISGVPQLPGVFYMAPNNGGVWKSVNSGRTWDPIFDGQDTGSIGALAVAPSNPSVVYVGSGEGLRRPDLSTGNGMYKSIDAGKTWTHQGLRDGQQIQQIAVDPRDANHLFVAVVGHPFGPNAERGLYRSTDGGATYAKVLGQGDDLGAVSVIIDPNHPDTVYADLWASRNGPWNLVQTYETYGAAGLYKSTDGGTTWAKLTTGLPKDTGRIGITLANADSNRLYLLVEETDGCGVYRSDDAGASWKKTNGEERVCGRTSDFAGITADPKERDTVYSANTSTWRSTDAGVTWTAIKGAPGGDDYHTVWIDPSNSDTIALAVDQGATISVDRGKTWSSWYNQPTAQFYHVITDDRFPYRVFGAQQESGSAEVLSRSDDGAITFRDFHPIGVEEYGYVAPDPLHPWLIYGGKASVYNERTGQTRDISPTYDRKTYHFDRTNPLVFNRVDKQTLYLGLNVVFATRDGGQRWSTISPDLTRPVGANPANLGAFSANDPLAGKHRGVIYSLSPAYTNARVIWAGTDDGLVWVTRDGGAHWRNISPPALTPWSRVTQIDSSHFDTATAYVSVSRERLDDRTPYIYRTHDFGATWTRIADGIPASEPVNTVREDPKRRGLLFAGTERTVHVSFDDGAHWQSLQGNLPSTSIRDLVIHTDDIVVGTHGRSFWILDDIAALREARTAGVQLFTPALAYRVRRDTWTDTPLPPEEPVGQNPPDGAIIDYTLPAGVHGPLAFDVLDAGGHRVRSFASTDSAEPLYPDMNVPTYWVRPTAIPPATPGDHRFVWDLHEAAPRSVSHDFPISAIAHATPHDPEGVLVMPGTYTVRLTVDGHTYTRPLRVALDPRVATRTAQLRAQHDLAERLVDGMNRTYASMDRATAAKDKAAVSRYARLNASLGRLYGLVVGSDSQPTDRQMLDANALIGGIAKGGNSPLEIPEGDEP